MEPKSQKITFSKKHRIFPEKSLIMIKVISEFLFLLSLFIFPRAADAKKYYPKRFE